MQLRMFPALLIYIASYLPLSVILLCQDIPTRAYTSPRCVTPGFDACAWPMDHPILAIGAVSVCLLCFALTLATIRVVKPKEKINLDAVEHIPADLMNYTLPYIVSLIGLDYGDKGKLLGFVVFFVWMFVISYRSGLIILNPVLAVFGWRLYEATYTYQGGTGQQRQDRILSNEPLEAGAIYARAAIQDVIILKAAPPEPPRAAK
jgi:hypothetical protein